MARAEGHSPANIMKHLKGIDFPVSKEQMLSHDEHAPGPDKDEVLETLKHLPEKEYRSPAEVMKEVGKVH